MDRIVNKKITYSEFIKSNPKFTGHAILKDGEVYLKEGTFHRIDGPAIIEGSEEIWLYEGLYHRIGAPAYKGNYFHFGIRFDPNSKEFKRKQLEFKLRVFLEDV